jgi:hypothetical protein
LDATSMGLPKSQCQITGLAAQTVLRILAPIALSAYLAAESCYESILGLNFGHVNRCFRTRRLCTYCNRP